MKPLVKLARVLLPLVAVVLATGCIAEVDDGELGETQHALSDRPTIFVDGDEEGPDPTPWHAPNDVSGPDPTPWRDLDESPPKSDTGSADGPDDSSGPDPTPWHPSSKGDNEDPDPHLWLGQPESETVEAEGG